MTIFWLRDKLHRDTAPVPSSNFIYLEKHSAIYQTCTPDDASHVRTFGATAPAFNKTCAWMAKSTPYLSCHREKFPAKVPGPARCPRHVTQPPFIAGPLGAMDEHLDN